MSPGPRNTRALQVLGRQQRTTSSGHFHGDDTMTMMTVSSASRQPHSNAGHAHCPGRASSPEQREAAQRSLSRGATAPWEVLPQPSSHVSKGPELRCPCLCNGAGDATSQVAAGSDQPALEDVLTRGLGQDRRPRCSNAGSGPHCFAPGHQQGQGWVPILLLGEIRDDNETVVPRPLEKTMEVC